MTPFKVPPPPVQQARFQPGFVPAAREAYAAELRPIPPEPSRLETREVVEDEWGRASLQGLAGDRYVVPAPEGAASDSRPVLCALAAFALGSLLLR